jgi:hypothetical protein
LSDDEPTVRTSHLSTKINISFVLLLFYSIISSKSYATDWKFHIDHSFGYCSLPNGSKYMWFDTRTSDTCCGQGITIALFYFSLKMIDLFSYNRECNSLQIIFLIFFYLCFSLKKKSLDEIILNICFLILTKLIIE